MDQLLDALQQLPAQTWAAVVHLGAGHGASVQPLLGLQPGRLVLVEGDPEASARLRRLSGLSEAVQVHSLVLGAEPGPGLWHRYSMATLNGPLDAMPWTRDYPRLRMLSAAPVEKVAVQDVLARALEGLEGQDHKLLIVDLPGQEDELLGAVPAALLQGFDWVILQGCAHPPSAAWSPADTAVARLTGLGYAVRPTQAAADPIWPVATMFFDAQAFRQRQWQEQLRAMEEHSRELEAEVTAGRQRQQETQAALLAANERVAQLQAQHQEANASAEAAMQALTKERDVLAKAREEALALVDQHLKRLEALGQEKASLITERDALAKRCTDLTAAGDQHAKLAAGLQQRISDLDKEKVGLVADRDALAKARAELTAARDEQAKRATESQQRVDVLGKEKAQLVAERDALAKERTALVAARDEQTKATREARQKLATLEAEMAEAMARHALLQEELIKAEAQIELIADVLLRENAV